MFLYYPFNAHGLCKEDQAAVAYFKMILSLSPCGKHEGIFPPDIRYDNLVGFLEVKFTKAWESLMTRSPLVSPTYPKWASNNSSITVQAFLPQDWVFWRFLFWQVTMSHCIQPVFLPNLVGNGFPCRILSRGNGGLKVRQVEDWRKQLQTWVKYHGFNQGYDCYWTKHVQVIRCAEFE